MNTNLKYMPVLRGRQQELLVLKSFDFGNNIFPCIEIVKELDRVAPKPRKNAKKPAKPKDPKIFEQVYLPIIEKIKAEKVFVDLPVHLVDKANMKPETIDFLRTVVSKIEVRTEYIKKLSPLASKVIPVISTYLMRTGEKGSILTQEKEIRKNFNTLAFRTFQNTFNQDIAQIEKIVKTTDYIIMDWEETELDETDGDQKDIIDKLKTLSCTVIVHRNPIPKEVTNVSLVHTKVIDSINNDLLDKYQEFSGSCFSDYSGIKKDGITKGGTVSPGFIYYDSVKNKFYGFKGERKELDEFEKTIVPAVISSGASTRMRSHALDFLGGANAGWATIQSINSKSESGKSPAKFKKIGMQHYLHCIKTKILNGDYA